MELRQGARVYVDGDAAEICTADYTVRNASMATVTEEPDPRDDYVRLSIDKIGGDRNAVVYVRKNALKDINQSMFNTNPED